MKNLIKSKVIYTFYVLVLFCQVPLQPEDTKPSFDESIYNGCRMYAEVFRLTKDKHYKAENLEQSIIKSLDTFLNSIDPHSNLLDPKAYKNMMEATSGEFFGIGVIIDNTRSSKDKHLTIIDTIPDGPADKAGVKPMDKIIEIEGKMLEGMSTDEATALLKGERHTKVNIKVIRENQTDFIPFEIQRDVIKEQSSLCFYIQDQNIYYLALTMFSDNAVRQLEQLLLQANKKAFKGLILDLRNNSGGLLQSAIDIAGLFLEKGSLVVTTKDKNGKVCEEYRTTRAPISTNIPIFILINNFTASAAEILAGALQYHANKFLDTHKKENQKSQNASVFLVGTKTFGKGSVQEVLPISNNCAIKLTTYLYFLPDGSSVQAEGIAPDFEVERYLPPTDQQQWISKNFGREQSLTNHIKLTEKKEEREKQSSQDKIKTWTARAKQMLLTDNQLRETIMLINLLSIGKQQCSLNTTNRSDMIHFLNNVFITSAKLNLVEVRVEKQY